jgi:serine/threonine protein phosphatase PrpC
MMSGTTVVVTLMYKNMIICANAGDSRAVLFGVSGGDPTWRATPLSRDHKPEDPDEATRIRASNGRVEQSKIMPGTTIFGVGGKQL